jgi:amidase
MSHRDDSLTRRTLLKTSLLGGAFAAAVPLPGLSGRAAAAEAQDGREDASSVPSFDFEEATISSLQKRMRSGDLSARDLAEAYLERIAALDRKGPNLRAVLELNPDALSIADQLDKERPAKGVRGPLHGIPVLIKGNVGTADRMTTTAGSLALEGSIPAKDSFIAARLREAGAVILGKTNLSEWANFRSTHSSSGWSSQGGQCRNPYALDRSPSGSSSGSGAAIASNFAAVAVGSETDGSIVSPSSASSLVGIKPTVGLVSRSGIVPISHTQDTAGPMARTVTDAAILLTILAGIDPQDSATAASKGKAEADYTKFLDPKGLQGARIGVARKRYAGYSEETDKVLEQALDALKKAGAVIVDPADIESGGKFDDAEFEVLLYDFKADLNSYLKSLGPNAPVHSMKEVIEFNDKNRDRVMPYFGQEIFLMAQEKGPLTEKAYKDALAKCRQLSRKEGIDATLAKNKLDAIVAPTSGPPWMIDPVNGDAGGGGSSSPAAVAGYASITVPAGYAFGLPIGLSFIGGAWSEPKLIRLAYAFEQETRARKAPRFLPTADLG